MPPWDRKTLTLGNVDLFIRRWRNVCARERRRRIPYNRETTFVTKIDYNVETLKFMKGCYPLGPPDLG